MAPGLDFKIDRARRPYYQQILRRIQALVKDGGLRAGERIPNQDELAQQLSVNVATVNRAYREAVKRRLLVSSPRRGTHVAPQSSFLAGWNGLQNERAGLIDMENNAAPIDRPMRAMSEVFSELSRQEDLRHLYGYGSIYGRLEQRRAMAQWLGQNGLEADPEHIILTGGAHHAIYLLLSELARPGDVLVVDELTYPCLDELVRIFSLGVHCLRRREGRLDLAHAARLFAEARPRFLFVMPDFASPTTEHLSEAERQELARLCRRHDTLVIEDSVHLGLVESKGRPLQAHLPQKTFFATSFSKILAPGLCLGMLLCPDREYTERIGRRLGIVSRMASPIMGEIATRLVTTGEIHRVLGFVRSEYRARNRIAADLLAAHRVMTAETGTHFWVELPAGSDGVELCERLRRLGVSVLPDRIFAVGSSTRAGFRATLGAPPRRNQVIEGCLAIAKALGSAPAEPARRASARS